MEIRKMAVKKGKIAKGKASFPRISETKLFGRPYLVWSQQN